MKTICERGKECIYLSKTTTIEKRGFFEKQYTILNYFCKKREKFLSFVEKYQMCKYKQTDTLSKYIGKGYTICEKCGVKFPSSLSKKHECEKTDIFG